MSRLTPIHSRETETDLFCAYRDGNIRYYEYEHDKFEYLSEYKSADPQRGVAFVPKRGVNTHQNEVMRAYKTVNETMIEPVSFIVPRRAEVFQNDIYPPTNGTTPSMGAADWFGGKDAALPPKISLESLYEGETPVEIPAERAPKPAQVKETPAPVPAAAPKAAEPAPQPIASSTPTTSREPVPSMKDNKASMSAMADRFADKDEPEESSDDETSSFEEIPKPVERPAATLAARQEEKTGARTPPQAQPSPTKATSAPTPSPAPEPIKPSNGSVDSAPAATSTSTQEPSISATGGARGAAEGIKGVLQEIKTMLAQQSEQIESLTHEVAGLKARLGEQ